jgi:hypothetical protein
VSAWRYLGGLLVLAVFLVPLCAGALRVRRWLAPALSGATGLCAQVIVVVSLIVLILEGLGLVGLLQAVPVAAAGAAVGGGLWVGLGDRQPPAARVPAASGSASFDRFAICIAGAVVAAPWLGWTVYAYRHGMDTPDTLWYHLPQAARFVQNGNLRELQYFDGGPVTAFYPANSELLHALGILSLRSDLLSPLINLFWGAFAMFAAWAVGRPSGRGAHTLLAMALLLGTPAFVDTQPGGAYNDIVCVALLTAAVAVLVEGGLSSGPLVLAAMAAGLTLGTKFTMIVPAVALGVGLVAVPAEMPRARRASICLAGLVGLGGFWYARNLVVTGTPAPTLPFHLGALFPTPDVGSATVTVWHNLFVGHVWRAYYLPGLRRAFGPGWWGILAVAAVGGLAAVAARRNPVVRVLGWVAVVAAVAYLLTPQFLGSPSAPTFFVYNLRYAAPALVLGLLLAPLAIPAEPRWLRNAALVVGLALLAATELDSAVWPSGIGNQPFAPTLRGTPAILGASLSIVLSLIAVTAIGQRVRRYPRPGWTYAAVAAVLVGGGWLLRGSYEKQRYASTEPLPRIYAWARSVHHARIGLEGTVAQYPLLGPDDSNFVQFLGRRAPHGGYGVLGSATEWRSALRGGRYGWVVVAPSGFPFSTQPAPQLAWTRALPGAREVISERPPGAPSYDTAVLFRLETTGR